MSLWPVVVLRVWAEDPAFPGVQVSRRQQWDPAQQGAVGGELGGVWGFPLRRGSDPH